MSAAAVATPARPAQSLSLRQRTCSALAQLDARAKLLALLLFALAVFHAGRWLMLGICCALSACLMWASNLSTRQALKALKPLAAILVVTAIAQIAYYQQGEVLFSVGPVSVTADALTQIAQMMLVLICVLVQSAAFMRCTNAEDLTRAFTQLVTPLQRIGLRVDAVVLTLNVAFSFIPALAAEFRTLKSAHEARLASFDGTVRTKLAAYQQLFGPLLRSSLRRADQLAEGFMSRCFSAGVQKGSLHERRFAFGDAVAVIIAAVLFVLTFVF